MGNKRKFNDQRRYVVAGEEPYQFTFTREGHGDKYTAERIARTVLLIGGGTGETDFETMKYDCFFKVSSGVNIYGGKVIRFDEITDEQSAKPPIGFRTDPRYVELKSKRYNALLKPSNFEKLQAAAKQYGISVNEVLNRVIEAVLQENE